MNEEKSVVRLNVKIVVDLTNYQIRNADYTIQVFALYSCLCILSLLT